MKSLFVLNVIGMDPNIRPEQFEAKQPRMSVSGDLWAYVVYVVAYEKLPTASQEAAWSQTLLDDL